MSQLGRLLECLVLTICPVAACSVINSYDDVVPAKGAGGADGGAQSGGGTTNHGGATNHAGTAGVSNPGGGDAGESSAGAAPTAPVSGLLAVAGTDPTKAGANVVSLIDPTTGKELARQALSGAAVVGLAYDGADGKDVFYEFTGASFPADPTSKAAMQVYSFVDASATWKVVSAKALPALPPPRPDTFVVLNDRLSYLSYTIVGGKPIDSLTVLDTTDPKNVTQLKFAALDFGADNEVLGVVGTRGVLGDETATGGTLAVVVGATCSGNRAVRACASIRLLPVTVGVDDVSQGVLVDFSPALIGEPAFASAQSGQLGYVAYTSGPNKSITLKHFDPRNLSQFNTGSAAFKSLWLGGLAYAECQDVALFTGVTQGSLYSASPAGLTGEQSLGYPGQGVVYEPFTQHAITLFNPDNANYADATSATGDGGAGGAPALEPALDSFDVTANAALSKTAAAKWAPPAGLAPNLAVARFPVSYMCK